MKKKKKDKPLKKWSDQWSKSKKHLILNPTDFIPQDKLDFLTQNLDILQEEIEDDISEWAVDKKEDLMDSGEDGIVRCLIISRGMDEYFVCFDPEGQIRGYSRKLPRDLISRICNAMNFIVRGSAMKYKND